ncbi:hypothetical protein [Flavobacterium aquidurense]|uniref:hypothetical protein n=1 Tax=Flavobacterium aquidurense TaxID=362413 RepID=UPI002858BA56|nr:hypothetical protein [Flavobacterium aquidurense]MDR7371310.1 hypothetical protein [Flavobacterium aquidurense]
MIKKGMLLVLLLVNLSCKKADDPDFKKIIREGIISKENVGSSRSNVKKTKNTELNCSQIIINLIKSSNIKNPFRDNLKIEIEDKNSVNMKLRLFDANDKSQNTIGWIIFDAENMRLLDITDDIERPLKLTFDHKLWNKIIECSFDNDRSYYFDENDKEEKINCKTIIVEMGKGEECILKNTTIENVYMHIIENEEVDCSKYLLNSIPKNNKIIEINKNGLMNIDYKIINDKIEISFNYDGGVTEIIIEKKANNVLRSIVYYAD